MEMLTCSKCHRELPTTEFFRNSSIKRGYTYLCKECLAKYNEDHKLKKEREKQSSGLRAFTSRDLMAELSRRSFYGVLHYKRDVDEEIVHNGISGSFTYTKVEDIDITKL